VNWKRVLGVVLLLIGLLGLVISVGGLIISRQAIEEIGDGLENTLRLTAESLDNFNETLVLTRSTISQVSDSLDTVGETAINVSNTMSYTQPLMDQVTQVATKDVPDSLETVQDTIPDVAEAAGAIDDTLRVLDSFQFERQVFGIPIQFDLGIDYDPSEPLDQTVLALGQGLDGVPESLRALEGNLTVASENLGVIAQNLLVLAEDLERINSSVAGIDPMIDEYLRLTAETSDLIRQTRTDLARQIELAKLAVTALFVWIGLNQVVPIYLGLDLILRKEEPQTNADIKQSEEPDSSIENDQDLPEEAQESDDFS